MTASALQVPAMQRPLAYCFITQDFTHVILTKRAAPLQPPLTEVSVLSSAVSVQTNTADLLHVTQTLFFLQVLPAGASKGKGVDQLLKHLDVQPDRVLAMGDGENDKVMLKVLAPILVALSRICCLSLWSCTSAWQAHVCWHTSCLCFSKYLHDTFPAIAAAIATVLPLGQILQTGFLSSMAHAASDLLAQTSLKPVSLVTKTIAINLAAMGQQHSKGAFTCSVG